MQSVLVEPIVTTQLGMVPGGDRPVTQAARECLQNAHDGLQESRYSYRRYSATSHPD